MTSIPSSGLPDISQVQTVPTYLLRNSAGRALSVVISLATLDPKGQPMLLPTVANAIHRTVEITSRTRHDHLHGKVR